MRTEPDQFHRRQFDVLVVGGGIHGAALAREVAMRGASVLLVERNDFGCGTSSRSSRLVHGGVRYLEQGHLALVREALHERERLLRALPHLVRPLPMLMPFFRDGGGRAPWVMKLGLRLYGWLAGRSTLPGARAYRPDDCVRLFPGLRTQGLRGGALFFDAATQDLPLTLVVLEHARREGAVLANHLELVGCRDDAVLLHDRRGGAEIEVRAGRILNAAGPRVDAVRRALGIDGDDVVRVTRGSHLVLPPRDCETALAAFLPDDRIQFVIPHRGATLCGTTDVDERLEAAEPSPPAADVDYILQGLAHLLEPPPQLRDVQFAYTGLRSLPAVSGPAGALHREAFLVDERCAAGSVHTVVGGKLTTHRSFAERAVSGMLGVAGASPSRTALLPGGDGPREHGDPLWWRHGSRAAAVRALAAGDADLLEAICPHRDFVGAEVRFARREQGAVTFADLALRRLFDPRGPCLEAACLQKLHGLWAREVDGADAGVDCAALRAEVTALTGHALA